LCPKTIAFPREFSIISLIKYFSRKFSLLEVQGDFAMLFAPKEKGQGLVEYALILVLVAVVVIAVLVLLGPAIGNVFSQIMSSL
jgi:pilus assembly protein Flp/PilA